MVVTSVNSVTRGGDKCAAGLTQWTRRNFLLYENERVWAFEVRPVAVSGTAADGSILSLHNETIPSKQKLIFVLRARPEILFVSGYINPLKPQISLKPSFLTRKKRRSSIIKKNKYFKTEIQFVDHKKHSLSVTGRNILMQWIQFLPHRKHCLHDT
jgi:hypothetical protein